MRPTVVLLPSALLGPAVWNPVATRLEQRGFRVVVAGRADRSRATVAETLDWYLEDLPTDNDCILVPHSNAGLYVPALTQRLRVTGMVFVDAILPPRVGPVTVAPARLQRFLADLADEHGLLPPWTAWWDEEDVAALFPSADLREEVEAAQPRLPLAYFLETIQVAEGWADRPGAYLAFGDAYDDARRSASDWGWPVQTLPGSHLHLLNEPDLVTSAISPFLGPGATA